MPTANETSPRYALIKSVEMFLLSWTGMGFVFMLFAAASAAFYFSAAKRKLSNPFLSTHKTENKSDMQP